MRSRGGMDMQHTLNTKTEFMTRWDGLTTGGSLQFIGVCAERPTKRPPEPSDQFFWKWPGDFRISEGRFRTF